MSRLYNEEKMPLSATLFRRVAIQLDYLQANIKRVKEYTDQVFANRMQDRITIEGDLILLSELEIKKINRLYVGIGGVPVWPGK